MHVTIAGLYAATVYLSILAYMVIVGLNPAWVLVTGPVIISGLIAALIAGEMAVAALQRLLRRFVGDPATE